MDIIDATYAGMLTHRFMNDEIKAVLEKVKENALKGHSNVSVPDLSMHAQLNLEYKRFKVRKDEESGGYTIFW